MTKLLLKYATMMIRPSGFRLRRTAKGNAAVKACGYDAATSWVFWIALVSPTATKYAACGNFAACDEAISCQEYAGVANGNVTMLMYAITMIRPRV
jgi:hypothetical protein